MNATKNSTNEKYITDKCEAYWYEPGVFYMRYYKDSRGDVDDVKAIIEFQKKLGVTPNDKRLLHAEKYVSITKEAREYVEQHAPDVKAEAFVIPSLSQKIIFNLYVKLRRNSHPLKGFDNLEDALAWLKSFG